MFEQHRAIYDAIATRNVVDAQNAMERHLNNVANYYWQAMRPGLAGPMRGGGVDGAGAEPSSGAGSEAACGSLA
jgi:hypothetical protein